MRHLMFFALVCISINAFSQHTIQDTTATNQYLKTSRRQKTAAWTMLGGGMALIGVGFLSASQNITDKSSGAESIVIVGLASSLLSIPFFIASSGNKRKAMRASASIKTFRNPLNAETPIAGLSIRLYY